MNTTRDTASWTAVNRLPQENRMSTFHSRPVALALALLLGAPLLSSPALAEGGDEGSDQVQDTENRPRPRPPAYRPRPYYRPPPRRVYVAPTYYPRPRREVEPVYDPIFHFGIGVNGTSAFSDDSAITDVGSGAGFDLSFGWRMAPSFSLDFNWLMSFHDADDTAGGDEAALTSFSIDGRFFLTDKSRQVQPYLQAGIGAYILGRDSWDYDTLTGVGFQLGGGVDIYLSRYVSIGGKLLYRGAHLDNAEDAWPSFPTQAAWLNAFTYGGDLKFHF